MALQLGIDLGGTKIAAVVLSPNGQPLWEHRVPTPRDDYRGTVQAIAAIISLAEQALQIPVQSLAVEPDRIGVLDEAGGWRDRARHPDSDRA